MQCKQLWNEEENLEIQIVLNYKDNDIKKTNTYF